MKTISAFWVAFSMAFSFALCSAASANPAINVSIPPFGLVCKATDNSMIVIVPQSERSVSIEVINPSGHVLSENNFILQQTGNEFIFSGWIEMEQTATLSLPHPESMKDAYFRFNFDAQKEWSVANVYSCDVM